MALTNDLVSQFVKVTKDDSKKKTDKTVYGTVVIYDESKYVKIDGSDLLTPIDATTKVSEGERVMVTIKNHTAVATGNLSNLPVNAGDLDNLSSEMVQRFDVIIADYVKTETLEADYAKIGIVEANAGKIKDLETANLTVTNRLDAVDGYIENLESENVKITGRLEANEADIETLTADTAIIRDDLVAASGTIGELVAKNAEITGRLEANEADIEDLNTKKLSAEQADIKYANIDFTNIGKAAMEYLYAESGLIRDVIVGDQTITGKLVGVTISGDVIEGGTIKADKIVVRGDDGLYYKLNVHENGARNLLTGTKDFNPSTLNFTISAWTVDEIYDDFLVKCYDNTSSETYINFFKRTEMFKRDTDYIVSFYAKGSGTLRCVTTNGATLPCRTLTSLGTTGYNNGSGLVSFPINEEWTRYWIRVRMENWDVESGSKELRLQVEAGSLVYFCGLKLEESQVVSDWTPAPEDNLYFDGMSYEDLNSGLHGSNIIAQTITAEKITVDDLVAFDATIGGFVIGDNSIHSIVKESVDNTTRGIYLDNDGQVNFGDSNNYLKYYQDDDGTYKLEISAASIKLGGSGRNVETALDDVKNAVDSIEVGGTNLLRNTGFIYVDNLEFDASGSNNIGTYAMDNEGGLHIVCSEQNVRCWLGVIPVTPGEQYAMSISYKINSGSSPLNLQYIFNDEVNNPVEYQSSENTIKSTREEDGWTVLTNILTIPSNDSIVNVRIAIRTGFDYENYTIDYNFKKPKFEIGNKATDWSPAPEDFENDITNAQNTADAAAAQSNANATRVHTALTEIDAIHATIRNIVTGQNGETLMTQTENGWTFDFTSFQNILNDATSNISSLNSDMSDTNSQVDILKKNLTDLGVYTEYIEFGTENGKPCIILGEHDSNFKVVITNTDIRFMEGSSIPASISNQSLNITKAVISDELKQGGFVWMARSNGNYGLMWKGE